MKVGSLFTGIGGLDLGLMACGHTISWMCENDKHCCRVLAVRFPGVPIYGDIRELRGQDLPPVDIMCAGWPCPPISCAGKRKGNEDERWLWPEVARLLREARPRWFLGENPAGLYSANHGREFGEVLRDLAQAGYDARWESIRASDVGAPHRRERVFIVAHSRRRGDDEGQQIGITGSGDQAVFGEESETMAGTDRSRWERGEKRKERREEGQQMLIERDKPLADSPGFGSQGSGHGPRREQDGQPTCRGRSADEGIELADSASQGLQERVGERRDDGAECAPAERGGLPLFPPGPDDREAWEAILKVRPDLAPAIPRMRKPLSRHDADDMAGTGYKYRTLDEAEILAEEGAKRLNPRFVEWLMGFPIGFTGVDGVSRCQRLKMLGNAVVPQCAAMAWRIR